LNLQPELTL